VGTCPELLGLDLFLLASACMMIPALPPPVAADAEEAQVDVPRSCIRHVTLRTTVDLKSLEQF
jgi:hypothetical protein